MRIPALPLQYSHRKWGDVLKRFVPEIAALILLVVATLPRASSADHAAARSGGPERHPVVGHEASSGRHEASARPIVPETQIVPPVELGASIDDLMRANGLASARPVGPIE